MGLKIVTGRTGTPHVSSNQIQAFNRSLLGDLAILDLGQHFDAVVRDANTVRIYDGCIVVQGIYAIIPHDEFEDILVEPVSVGNTRIDTIYLHYAKDMESDTESVELDIAQGEEAVNNPVKPDIDAGGDTWEGTTDIRIPLYDVTVTSFETTITAYEYMDVYSPNISDLNQRIPETTVSGVKGDAESEYRSGNVNITPANIGLGNVDNTSDTDKPVSTAQQEALDDKVDKVTGKGLSTNDYTNEEKQKNADNASAISDIQEDISQSLTATGNPLTIESAEANAVECVAEVEAVQDLHGYDHPWVGGAGKNKLPMTVDGIKAANTSGTWSGNVYTYNGVSFTILTDLNNNVTGIKVNGTASATSFFVLNTNLSFTVQTILNGNTLPNASESNCLRFIDGGGNSRTDLGSGVSIPANFAGQTQIRLNSGYSVSNIILYPMIRLATETDSTFAPYSNISPIIGQTEVVIEDVGKNISTGVEQGSFGTNGVNGSSNTRCRSIGYIPVTTGTEYVLNGKPDNVYASISYFANNTNIERISGTTWESLPYKFTPPSNCRYIRVMFSFDSGAQTNITPSDISNLIITDNLKTYRVEIGQKNKVEDTLTGANIGSNGQIGSDSNYDLAIAKVKSGVTYTITTDDSVGFVGGFFTNKPTPQATSYNNSRIVTANKTFTAPIDGYIAFRTNKGYTTPQCEQGSQATPYVPYNPNLPDAIYGGELDVLTGELRVPHGEVDLGTLNWTLSDGFFRTNDLISTVKKPINNQTMVNAISSVYPIMTWAAINTTDTAIAVSVTGQMIVANPNITNVSDFVTAVAGQQLVYELAEPYTIQLTPQQIRLLKGTNHLSCNTGDLTIKYYPDNVLGQLKGDIEKGLNAYYDYQIQALWDKINELQA